MRISQNEEVIEVVDVVFDPRVAGSNATFTYSNSGAVRGDLVLVPLGARSLVGIVWRAATILESDLGFPLAALRPISGVVAGGRIPESLLDLAQWLAERLIVSLEEAVRLLLPPGVEQYIRTRWDLASGLEVPLSPAQETVVSLLKESGGFIVESKARPLEAGARRQLAALTKKGLVEQSRTIAPAVTKSRLPSRLMLTADSTKIDEFLAKLGSKKPAQAMLLMRMQGSSSIAFSPQEIKALTGATDQTVLQLMQIGLLAEVQGEKFEQKAPPQLNPEQSIAVEAISRVVKSGVQQEFLLFGITGSGKTEVYIRAAEQALRAGKQVLYLVPEIALTAQVISQLRSRFGKGVTLLHSNLTVQERLSSWMKIAQGEAAVILGARSAVFSPVTNLGLIIVDEEHEGSYKQESSPRYHTHECVRFLSKELGIPVVFGSATPSIESYYGAQHDRSQLLTLTQRTAKAVLPKVEVFDLTQMYREPGTHSIFSDLLKSKMSETLARGEQVILFINRRAFAPFLLCRMCGYRFVCPHCAASLSYHKKKRVLKCHHCGYLLAAPNACPDCDSDKVAPFGVGSERVEATVKEEFPDISIARLDRDIASKKGALEDVLSKFRLGETQVLVGTQMVAKGLDFPNVTLVGVIAADISLNIPDFRSSERTFQLLSQVGGRAGRGERPGEVIIQTLSPDNPAILATVRHDYEGFYQSILEERKEANYPPFCDLVSLLFTSESQTETLNIAENLKKLLLASKAPATILGPVDCPIERIAGMWRVHLLIKHTQPEILNEIKCALEKIDRKSVHITVDVNPNSLL